MPTPTISSPGSATADVPSDDPVLESNDAKRKRERLSLESNKTDESIDTADVAESSSSAAAGPSKATKKSKKRARNADSLAQNVIVEATEAGAGAGAGAEAEAEAEAEGADDGVDNGVDDETAVQANESAASDVNAETESAESAAAAE